MQLRWMLVGHEAEVTAEKRTKDHEGPPAMRQHECAKIASEGEMRLYTLRNTGKRRTLVVFKVLILYPFFAHSFTILGPLFYREWKSEWCPENALGKLVVPPKRPCLP